MMSAYGRLMRVDKPVGFFLLWAPTAWALCLANPQTIPWRLWGLFFLGTWVMRAAGCIINDLADRRIDPHVQRTCLRPLATGEIHPRGALICLGVLLSVALCIVLNLPWMCLVEAMIALMMTILYPFCKRFFQAPQCVLGLAFSMGIPMAYTASLMPFDRCMWLLCVLNIAWIVAYDTMYALVDREDDQKIGVYSTAIWFGAYDVSVILGLQGLCQSLWLIIAYWQQAGPWFYVVWGLSFGFVLYQQILLRQRTRESALRAFLNNAWYGLWMWFALVQ